MSMIIYFSSIKYNALTDYLNKLNTTNDTTTMYIYQFVFYNNAINCICIARMI